MISSRCPDLSKCRKFVLMAGLEVKMNKIKTAEYELTYYTKT
jgi:hypothetical protein